MAIIGIGIVSCLICIHLVNVLTCCVLTNEKQQNLLELFLSTTTLRKVILGRVASIHFLLMHTIFISTIAWSNVS